MTTVHPRDLLAGDTFDRPFKPYRGKAKPVTYTVQGHAAHNGRELVRVRSTVQGDGTIGYDTLGDAVEVTNR